MLKISDSFWIDPQEILYISDPRVVLKNGTQLALQSNNMAKLLEQLATYNDVSLYSKLENLMATIEEIKEAVARDTEVTQSAITLLRSIHEQLEAAKNDPVALQEVLDGLNSNTDQLAAAVAENTTG